MTKKPEDASVASSGDNSFSFGGRSLKLAVEGGKPSPLLSLGPKGIKFYSQRGPPNPFFKKGKGEKNVYNFLPVTREHHHFELLKNAATAFPRT